MDGENIKIKMIPLPTMTLEDFAEQHNLTMIVTERPRPGDAKMRYYARFEKCEVKQGNILAGECGNGSDPDSAISDYMEAIQLKTISIDSFSDTRREIAVPRLVRRIEPQTILHDTKKGFFTNAPVQQGE